MSRISMAEAWSGVADCRSCTLREQALFANLTEDDFAKIHTPIEQNIFQPGEHLFRKDDPARDMFTVRKGLVKIVTYLPDGTQRIVRLLRPGDVGGLSALVKDVYQHDAIAMIRSETCRFQARMVNELSHDNPQLHDGLMHRWQKALSRADSWLSEFSTGSAKQRVARLFLQFAREENSGYVTLFSREDVGALLGVTTETASRTVAEFKRKKLICETSANVFQCDMDGLERLANE